MGLPGMSGHDRRGTSSLTFFGQPVLRRVLPPPHKGSRGCLTHVDSLSLFWTAFAREGVGHTLLLAPRLTFVPLFSGLTDQATSSLTHILLVRVRPDQQLTLLRSTLLTDLNWDSRRV